MTEGPAWAASASAASRVCLDAIGEPSTPFEERILRTTEAEARAALGEQGFSDAVSSGLAEGAQTALLEGVAR